MPWRKSDRIRGCAPARTGPLRFSGASPASVGREASVGGQRWADFAPSRGCRGRGERPRHPSGVLLDLAERAGQGHLDHWEVHGLDLVHGLADLVDGFLKLGRRLLGFRISRRGLRPELGHESLQVPHELLAVGRGEFIAREGQARLVDFLDGFGDLGRNGRFGLFRGGPRVRVERRRQKKGRGRPQETHLFIYRSKTELNQDLRPWPLPV